MNMWRLGGSIVLLTSLFVVTAALVPVYGQGDKDKDKDKDKVPAPPSLTQDKDKDKEKPKETPKEAPKDAPKTEETGFVYKSFAKKDNKFYQTLETTTKQKMVVMGQEVNQEQKQTFYIEWVVNEPKGDDYIVTQKIIGVKMNINIGGNQISYDSTDPNALQNPMTEFFKALTQAELKLTIDSKTMKVKDIDGADQLIDKLGGQNAQLQPLLKTILSKDALKQMAEPTWGAFPTKVVAKGGSWDKEYDLKLGGIGSYATKYTYTLESDDKSQAKVKIDATLKYSAPTDKQGLPFAIKSAELSSTKGTGNAVFDKDKGYIKSSEVNMELKGKLDIEISGMVTPVTLEQTQTSKVDTSDSSPIQKK